MDEYLKKFSSYSQIDEQSAEILEVDSDEEDEPGEVVSMAPLIEESIKLLNQFSVDESIPML